MSILKIIKLQSGAFKHNDSVDGDFFLGRFNYKNEFNIAFLVEAYGAKRREYVIGDIEVFDYLGTQEDFTNFTDLNNRLVELGYTGIDTNLIPFIFIPGDYDLTEFTNNDADPFARMSDIGGGGGSSFQGDWNAETNSPTLVNGIGTEGHEYRNTSSFYRFGEIILVDDWVGYVNGVWVKTRDNNQDIATRYPISYVNTNDGSSTQEFGEADYSENSGAINNAAAAIDYILIDGANTYLNARRFRTQSLANSTTNVRNTSWNRIMQNQGFYVDFSIINADVSSNSGSRGVFAYSSQAFGNIDPSALVGYFFGFGADAADTTLHVFSKTSSAANTGVARDDTTWDKTDIDRINVKFFREISSSKLFYILYNQTTNTFHKGMLTFNPASIGITRNFYKSSGANAIATGFHHLHTNLNTSL